MRDLTAFPSILLSYFSTSFESHDIFVQSFGLVIAPDTLSDECLLACALARRVGVRSWRSLNVWGKRSVGLRWLPTELNSESSEGRCRSNESLQLQDSHRKNYHYKRSLGEILWEKFKFKWTSNRLSKKIFNTHRTWLIKAAWNITYCKSNKLSRKIENIRRCDYLVKARSKL